MVTKSNKTDEANSLDFKRLISFLQRYTFKKRLRCRHLHYDIYKRNMEKDLNFPREATVGDLTQAVNKSNQEATDAGYSF